MKKSKYMPHLIVEYIESESDGKEKTTIVNLKMTVDILNQKNGRHLLE
jgi:hypothetical protein